MQLIVLSIYCMVGDQKIIPIPYSVQDLPMSENSFFQLLLPMTLIELIILQQEALQYKNIPLVIADWQAN